MFHCERGNVIFEGAQCDVEKRLTRWKGHSFLISPRLRRSSLPLCLGLSLHVCLISSPRATRSLVPAHSHTQRLLFLHLQTRRQLVYFINSELPWISSSAAVALGSVNTFLTPLSPPAAVISVESPPPFSAVITSFVLVSNISLFTFNIHIFTFIYCIL